MSGMSGMFGMSGMSGMSGMGMDSSTGGMFLGHNKYLARTYWIIIAVVLMARWLFRILAQVNAYHRYAIEVLLLPTGCCRQRD